MGSGTMSLFYALFLSLLALSALVAGGIGIYAMRRRETRGAKSLAVQMLGTTWWMLSYGLMKAALESPVFAEIVPVAPLFWFKALFLGVVLIPAAFFTFTRQFVDSHYVIDRYTLALLAIEPVAVTALIWTDPYHGLFLGDYQSGSGESFIGGIVFWLHSLYSYVLVFACYIMLVRSAWRSSSRLHRNQAVLMLLAALPVSLTNLATILHLVPVNNLDLTPFGFVLMGLAMMYNIRGQGFLDLLPIARDAVVEGMSDGVLVMDKSARTMDLNRSVLALLGKEEVKPGTPVADVFPFWETLVASNPDPEALLNDEIVLHYPDKRHINVQVTPLRDSRSKFIGRILVLRNVTAMKNIEAELRDQLNRNEALRRELQEQAVRDPLTGLFNRRFLEETLTQELAQAARGKAAVVLCMIDIDHFKAINDNFGHGVGDQVIRMLADFLQAETRAGDVVCRVGGEEFVVVMPGASLEAGFQRVEHLRQGFSRLRFDRQEERGVTFSAGVACAPLHGRDAQALMMAADRALYHAKDAGRNRVCAATAPHYSGVTGKGS